MTNKISDRLRFVMQETDNPKLIKIYCIKNKISMTDKIDELIRKEIRK